MYGSSTNDLQAQHTVQQPVHAPNTVLPNGHNTHHNQQRPPPNANVPKEPINVVGIPSVHIENGQFVVGSSQTSSTRSYTPLKVLGDGSFGTVWLCDWHGTLPPNTPLSPMQCGAGARPEWVGKRLVAVKRMKKKWDGGWDDCQKLKEIESLRAIPFHPNIIPLYDFFLLPASKELYFVFESMEGNLYHLIKARKGRPLAGGLVSSIFHQIVSGLHHIHSSGYFHRDMKPENVLVTTTGLFDYVPLSPIAPPNAPPEKDVVAIIKLADFGLARETKSKPPYTEYVATRWYRAPEVLLYSRNYSNPVDMWALGTIMAELVNLRPLFPGANQRDQIHQICEILGDPSSEYRSEGSHLGGGPWPKGVKMAREIGYQFPKMPPKDFFSLFDRTVPLSLIHCIRDLLKYDPDARLTSRQCLHHPYLLETAPRNNVPLPAILPPPTPHHNGVNGAAPSPLSARSINQRSHSGWTTHTSASDDAMDTSPGELSEDMGHPMDVHPTQRIHPEPGMEPDIAQISSGNKSHKLSLPFGKKHGRWPLGMFGSDRSHGLPPVQEIPAPSGSTSSLKRSQSSGSDSRSVRDSSPSRQDSRVDINKRNKKEAEKVQREAEKQKRALAEKMQKEQARAVMQKRNQIVVKKDDIEWIGGANSRQEWENMRGKPAATGPIRQNHGHGNGVPFVTVSAAGPSEWRRDERLTKARRIDFDDDHSMSSSDIHSIGRMSTISFATVDSDPGPSSQIRNRPSQIFGLNRMQSTSSLRTSFDELAPSARSSNSFSLEGQLAHDFTTLAQVNPATPLSGSISPPPMQMLSISPSLSPSLSPSSPWMQLQQENLTSSRGQAPPYVSVPDPRYPSPKPPQSPFEFNGHAHPPNPYEHPPNSGRTSESDINPIFKVVSYQWDAEGGFIPDVVKFPQPPLSSDEDMNDFHRLPPFSELEAVAGAGYDSPPLSPMEFTTPED